MKIVLLHNHYSKSHLAEVVEKMKRMGAPVIKAYEYDINEPVAQAIEGCHRLRACEILGIDPEIEWIDLDAKIGDIDIDVDKDPNDIVATLGALGNDAIDFDI